MRNVLAGVLGAVVLAAPLAATAQRGPVVQLSTVDGRIEKISPHVHMIAAWPNAGFVVGETGVLVIDTVLGYDNGAAMARAAARLATNGQKIYLVTTHYHTEHAGGQNAFPAPATVVRARTQQAELETDGPGVVKMFASRNDEFARLLTPPQDTRADILFDGEYRLDLGGGVIARLVNLPGGHTMGDTVILAEPDGVLFAGDLVESLRTPSVGCTRCSPRQWIAALDEIAKMGPRIIVPTHGPAPVDPSFIAAMRGFLVDQDTRAAALKAQGRTAADATAAILAEFKTRYPNWTGIENLNISAPKAYAEAP